MSSRPDDFELNRTRRRPPPPPRPPRSVDATHSSHVEDSVLQKLIRNRKLKVRAVAVGVGVVCCALFGAQLKTTIQEIYASKKITDTASDYMKEAGTVPPAELRETSQQIPSEVQQPHQSQAAKQSRGIAFEVARRIASLEDRKALLNRQKQTLEAKIEMLRERRAKKVELEALRDIERVER